MASKYVKALWVFVVVYIAFFSAYSVFRLYAFEHFYAPGYVLCDTHTFYSDLINTLHGNGFFYSPYEGTSHFAVHNSPILFLLLPIVALFPHIETILVVQSIFIGLGAVGLFYFAREVLKSEKSALLLALMYLINPFVHGINKADFHACALAIPFAFLTAYFYETGRTKPMLVSATLVLSAREDAGLFLIALMWMGIMRKDSPMGSLKPRTWLRNRLELTMVLLAVLWMAASLVLIFWFNGWVPPRWMARYHGTPNFLRERGWSFVALVLLSMGFLPLLQPRFLIPSAPLWAELLLGASWAMVSYDFYYTYMLVPFLFIVSVYAVSENPRMLRKGFLIALVSSILFSPVYGVTRIGPYDSVYFWARFLGRMLHGMG
ncbi:DUF2079 domain-containing protein [Thermococcus prieurii]